MNTYAGDLIQISDKVLDRQRITEKEAAFLLDADGSDLFLLMAMANKIREQFCGDKVDLCAVVSGRSGGCPEDCAFCAQSAHAKSGVVCHPLLSEDELVRLALEKEKAGAVHMDIATSGKGFTGDEEDFQAILRAFARIKKETGLKLCACLGTLTPKAVRALAACGVERCSINLQTGKSFFRQVITTHTYQERIDTIRYAKEAGMEVCSGTILGMGETPAQRLELAFLLRDLDVDAVPVNILVPVRGTPLEHAAPLSPAEILKTFAVFRFILPDKNIRYAAGRETSLRSLQPLGLLSGLNGMLIGDCLTVDGADKSKDRQMLKDLGLSF